MYRKSFSQPHIHQQYTYTTTNMFTNTTPTLTFLKNSGSLGFETSSNNSDHQDKSSGLCTDHRWEMELAELQNGHSTKNQKKILVPNQKKAPHKKKRPASLKSCVNPNCTHQMGCKAKKCKVCKTQQPYKFTKATKPKAANKGYGNGKLVCSSCHAKWGTRKLCCDCGAENIWDKKKTLKNTKKRSRSIPNVPTVHKKAPKRQRCNSFEEFLSKQLTEAEAQFTLKPASPIARPRGDSLVPLESDSQAPEEAFGNTFWPLQSDERPRFDSFELDASPTFDSFALAPTDALETFVINNTDISV